MPAVDTVLMLRPTESPTLFLQQLGRGLRKSKNKAFCTVLDFVGTHRREFRFDQRYRALLGGSRRDLERAVRLEFPFLPAGCYMELDQKASEIVLRSLREAIPTRWPAKVHELRSLRRERPDLDLAGFLVRVRPRPRRRLRRRQELVRPPGGRRRTRPDRRSRRGSLPPGHRSPPPRRRRGADHNVSATARLESGTGCRGAPGARAPPRSHARRGHGRPGTDQGVDTARCNGPALGTPSGADRVARTFARARREDRPRALHHCRPTPRRRSRSTPATAGLRSYLPWVLPTVPRSPPGRVASTRPRLQELSFSPSHSTRAAVGSLRRHDIGTMPSAVP